MLAGYDSLTKRDILYFEWKYLYGSNIIVVVIPLSCDSGNLLQ